MNSMYRQKRKIMLRYLLAIISISLVHFGSGELSFAFVCMV